VHVRLHGIDFTSTPRRAKPITIASGRLDGESVQVETLTRLPDWTAFDAFLNRPGPWLGAFDFSFGLPQSFDPLEGLIATVPVPWRVDS